MYTVCYALMCMALGAYLNYSGGGDVRAAVATTIAATLQPQQLLLRLTLFLLQLLLLLLLLLTAPVVLVLFWCWCWCYCWCYC